MKNFIVFILWAIIWLVIWGKLGYDYVMTQFTDNMSSIVDTFVSSDANTGSTWMFETYQWKAEEAIIEQKIKIKAQIKQQLTDYLMQKIDENF
jgi:hypothetical protein